MYPVPESYRQAMAAAVRSERLRGALALADGGVLEFGPADLMSGSVIRLGLFGDLVAKTP